MRKIEERIVRALKIGESLYYKNEHDVVYSDGTAYLLGTCYVQIKDSTIKLGIYGGKWRTVTTKGRINAVASAFNLPHIYQENYSWIWSDGVPYDGVREFTRGVKNEFTHRLFSRAVFCPSDAGRYIYR